MKKSELWAIYVRRNPSFDGDGNVTMSARGLQKLFETTWHTAFYDGEAEEPMPTTASVEQLKAIFGWR